MHFASTGHYENEELPEEIEPFGWKIGLKNQDFFNLKMGEKE